jgi:hypothetical protein
MFAATALHHRDAGRGLDLYKAGWGAGLMQMKWTRGRVATACTPLALAPSPPACMHCFRSPRCAEISGVYAPNGNPGLCHGLHPQCQPPASRYHRGGGVIHTYTGYNRIDSKFGCSSSRRPRPNQPMQISYTCQTPETATSTTTGNHHATYTWFVILSDNSLIFWRACRLWIVAHIYCSQIRFQAGFQSHPWPMIIEVPSVILQAALMLSQIFSIMCCCIKKPKNSSTWGMLWLYSSFFLFCPRWQCSLCARNILCLTINISPSQFWQIRIHWVQMNVCKKVCVLMNGIVHF